MPSLPIPSAPDRLAVEHLAIVQAAAKWLGVPSTDTVRDDLVSAGQEALIMASRRFEPAKASFSTYAGRRVVGSMLNVLADSPRAAGYWYLSDDEPPVQELAVAPDAERSALTSEVMAALGKLPPASQDLNQGPLPRRANSCRRGHSPRPVEDSHLGSPFARAGATPCPPTRRLLHLAPTSQDQQAPLQPAGKGPGAPPRPSFPHQPLPASA